MLPLECFVILRLGLAKNNLYAKLKVSDSTCYEDIYSSSALADIGDRLLTIDMGRKVGRAAVPLSEGGAGSPSNRTWTVPRSTSLPSCILIHSSFLASTNIGLKL